MNSDRQQCESPGCLADATAVSVQAAPGGASVCTFCCAGHAPPNAKPIVRQFRVVAGRIEDGKRTPFRFQCGCIRRIPAVVNADGEIVSPAVEMPTVLHHAERQPGTIVVCPKCRRRWRVESDSLVTPVEA